MADLPPGTASIGLVRIIARTNVGGPALQVTALMRHLDSQRFDQTLLRGSCDVGETDYLELRAPDVASTTVHGMGRDVRFLGDIRALWFIYRELRRLRPQIIHTHTAKAGTLGRLAALAAGVPIRVHTFHGHVLTGYFGPWTTRAVIYVERILARTTTYIVAVGDRTLDDLVDAKIADPARSRAIAPGVEHVDEVGAASARQTLGLPIGAQLLMFVGRLTAIKRPERFVHLAEDLCHDFPDAVFVFVGDGTLRADLEEQAGPNVRFLGWQSDIPLIMQAADLIVLTSDNEGMPVALIEAAMYGVPAVSTDAGATRRVILDGETGIVVDIGDRPALTAAVRALLGDPARRAAFSVRARQHADQQFSEERLVGDYTRLYEELLAERATSTSPSSSNVRCGSPPDLRRARTPAYAGTPRAPRSTAGRWARSQRWHR